MGFYGPKDRTRLQGLLQNLMDFLAEEDVPVFHGDNLIALARVFSFARDERFMDAYNRPPRKFDNSMMWRLHTYCWAAKSALAVPGDFVECGVLMGNYAAILIDYLDWPVAGRTLHLYDTFSGLSPDYATEEELGLLGESYDIENWYEQVVERFRDRDRVEVIRGVVPDILHERSPKEIAFLHLDMNAGPAETGALDVLFERMPDGGIVLMDDYGRLEQLPLHEALYGWMDAHNHPVLELPTGQGLVVKRSA